MTVIDPSREDPCLYMTCPPPPTWCGEIIPEGLCDHVDVWVDNYFDFGIEVLKEISDAELKFHSGQVDFKIHGKKITDSSLNVKTTKGYDRTIVYLATTKFNTSDIIFKGPSDGDAVLDVITGRFDNNSITFQKKKSDNLVVFEDDVLINNATINTGGGTDMITFMENSVIRGINEITLGPGRDILELPANMRGKGKIVVTDLSSNDTIKIGDQSFRGKGILKGKMNLPEYIQLKSNR